MPCSPSSTLPCRVALVREHEAKHAFRDKLQTKPQPEGPCRRALASCGSTSNSALALTIKAALVFTSNAALVLTSKAALVLTCKDTQVPDARGHLRLVLGRHVRGAPRGRRGGARAVVSGPPSRGGDGGNGARHGRDRHHGVRCSPSFRAPYTRGERERRKKGERERRKRKRKRKSRKKKGEEGERARARAI